MFQNDGNARLLPRLRIGNIDMSAPLTLAPMAGQTNHAFRRVCREIGRDCGLVCSELLSSAAIHYRNKLTLGMFDWSRAEQPVRRAAVRQRPGASWPRPPQIVVDGGADIVDINMGCWVPKVARKRGGRGALRDVCTAAAVVEAVVKAVSVPVTVKVRAGWDANEPDGGRRSRALPKRRRRGDCRSWPHRRAGLHRPGRLGHHPPGEGGREVSRSSATATCSRPKTRPGCSRETGCDAIMIGRGALGNPWIFRQIAHDLRTGEHAAAARRRRSGRGRPAPRPAGRRDVAHRRAPDGARAARPAHQVSPGHALCRLAAHLARAGRDAGRAGGHLRPRGE